jgi:hypothetical protein
MATTDPEPISSYSDPIYDRLDVVATAVRKRWWIYVTAILLVTAGAIVIRSYLINKSDMASATAFTRAMDADEGDPRTGRLKALAEDPKADAYYRGRAWIELTQIRIDQDDANGAKDAAIHALAQARISADVELQDAARLSQAAAEYQLQQYSDALADYDAVATSSSRFPMLHLEAALGEARAQTQLHQTADAIATLEPLLDRKDAGAQPLLELARVMYWNLKRSLAPAAGSSPALAPAGATGSATAAAVAPPSATPATATTAAAPAAAPVASRPTLAPATPAPTPAVVPAPAPTH